MSETPKIFIVFAFVGILLIPSSSYKKETGELPVSITRQVAGGVRLKAQHLLPGAGL